MGEPSWQQRAMHLRVLRVEDGGDVGEGPDAGDILGRPDLSLAGYVEHCLLPKLDGKRDPKTIRRLLDALQWWVRLAGDPPLALISDRDIAYFEQQLRRQRGRKAEFLASETVRQTLVRLRYLLRQAAKLHVVQGRRLRFLETVPEFELPSKTKTDANPYSPSELAAILREAATMHWPTLDGVSAAAWWTAIFEYLYYEGSRIEETLQLEYDWLAGDVLTVHDAAAKKRHGAKIWLQPESHAALERIRTARRYIFQTPRGWQRDQDKVKREARRLLRAAGVYVKWRVFHGVRRTNASEVMRRAGKQAAQVVMRHNDARTTEAYISDSARREYDHEVKRLLPRLPRDDQQLRLPFGD